MANVETLVRQLAEIQDRLIELPDDAFVERFDLLRRQDELRAQAAHYAEGVDTERPTEDLLAELASLRSRRDKAEGQRINTMLQASNLDAAGFSGHADAAAINRRIDAAQGLPRIEGRIGRITGILIDRGIDPGH